MAGPFPCFVPEGPGLNSDGAPVAPPLEQ